MPRVLHLNEHLACKGGVETYLLGVLPRLEEAGWSTAVSFCGAVNEAPSGLEVHSVPELSRLDRRSRARGYQGLSEILDRDRPDVVHVHNVQNTGAIQACLERVPTVLTGHDYRFVCPASSFYFRRSEEVCTRTCGPMCFVKATTKGCLTLRPSTAVRYYQRVRWAMRNAGRFAHLVAPSHAAQQRFLAAGFRSDRSTVVPYFCPVRVQAEPRPLPERPTVLFMGRLAANKGYRQFVGALGRLSPDVKGVMVGSMTPERSAEVQALARASGCLDRLQLIPWASREDVPRLLSESTVFVFPSLWPETLGIVGLEALACGVPVVASDVGGVREWLHDGRTGTLVPPGNVDALADGLRSLLASPETNRAMGLAGQELIRTRFSVERHVASIVSIYEDAAKLKTAHHEVLVRGGS